MVDLYRRVIESKDVELLKRVRPGQTVPETLRIAQAFAQNKNQQQLDVTVHDVTLRGDEGVASVTVRTLTRHEAFNVVSVDTSKGLITLRRGPAGWFITTIDMNCVEGCFRTP